ncbi:DUF427 domain-containing protein [Actinokineospora xionganensis]|uniref:DUF427 domain-containing protein n=1 Tax=Actinokineospora xionganensis TaxID=2684470 RepID=A0ABR7L341_9PSEU|nr:DUF427 domain-containing protein [Actinokineospora xionganensis]MBC6447084.1 DUF427 domain-containing protein [Actinokineospora xionganensis]
MALRMKHHLGSAVSDLRYEPVPFRTRARVADSVVVDTSAAILVWEPRRLVPVYAVPVGDIRGQVVPTEPQPQPPDLATLPPMVGPSDFGVHTCPGMVVDLVVDGVTLPQVGFVAVDHDLAGMVILDFGAFDSWWAEEQETVGHAHDPFKRIEVLTSSRLVEVSHAGVLLAASDRPKLLLETHLPPRWYIPPEHVEPALLTPSTTKSTCAYKGHASYLSLAGDSPAGADLAWHYPNPLHDAEPVRDHICFWAERTDLVVDGRPHPRPVTPWSRPEEQAAADPDTLEFG